MSTAGLRMTDGSCVVACSSPRLSLMQTEEDGS
jgi:hypothetical protein